MDKIKINTDAKEVKNHKINYKNSILFNETITNDPIKKIKDRIDKTCEWLKNNKHYSYLKGQTPEAFQKEFLQIAKYADYIKPLIDNNVNKKFFLESYQDYANQLEKMHRDLEQLKTRSIITDAGNIIELTNPPQGPYLNREFEEQIFEWQGYTCITNDSKQMDNQQKEIHHKVDIIRYPNYPSNNLGYALLGKGCISSTQAETILEDNFTHTKKPRLGDRLIYREPSTRKGIKGKIIFGGWIEKIEEGKVTEISSIWRDRGAICQYSPDIPNWPKDIEYYHRNIKLLDNFEQIDGKTEILDAKVICLGENHADDTHHRHIIQLINSTAKDGDLLLVEGLEAGQEVEKESWQHQRANSLASLFDNQEEAISFLESLPSLSKNVRVIGWDNIAVHNNPETDPKKEMQIHADITQAQQTGNWEKLVTLENQRELLYKKMLSDLTKRNKSLVDTIDIMRSNFQDKRIFVIGGGDHFTKDPTLIEKLEKQPYIALQPIYEISPEQAIKRAHKYTNTN